MKTYEIQELKEKENDVVNFDICHCVKLGQDPLHHTLQDQILWATARWLGYGDTLNGGGNFFSFQSGEGAIAFINVAGEFTWENATLISGADGATSCWTVQATYTAPAATHISELRLAGTYNGRDLKQVFSIEGVSKNLGSGQDYVVTWMVCALFCP